jgi:hypothetical protein
MERIFVESVARYAYRFIVQPHVPYLAKADLFAVKCSTIMEMKANNVNAPYNFKEVLPPLLQHSLIH